jgi:hypothetical protein
MPARTKAKRNFAGWNVLKGKPIFQTACLQQLCTYHTKPRSNMTSVLTSNKREESLVNAADQIESAFGRIIGQTCNQLKKRNGCKKRGDRGRTQRLSWRMIAWETKEVSAGGSDKGGQQQDFNVEDKEWPGLPDVEQMSRKRLEGRQGNTCGNQDTTRANKKYANNTCISTGEKRKGAHGTRRTTTATRNEIDAQKLKVGAPGLQGGRKKVGSQNAKNNFNNNARSATNVYNIEKTTQRFYAHTGFVMAGEDLYRLVNNGRVVDAEGLKSCDGCECPDGGEPSSRSVCTAMLRDVLQVPPGDQPGLVYAVVEISVLDLELVDEL